MEQPFDCASSSHSALKRKDPGRDEYAKIMVNDDEEQSAC